MAVHEISRIINKITIVSDGDDRSKLLTRIKPEALTRPVRMAFVNAHAYNLCYKNSDFFQHLLNSDYVLRDGSGMKILYHMLGKDPGLNMNGTDFIPDIIKLYRGERVALLGTGDPYLKRSAEELQKIYGIQPVLLVDGFQKDEFYLEVLGMKPASLIILAMGMPKQERVASLLANRIDYPCLIICGGAILDFIGGRVIRAPLLFRRFGMEWLYRLLQEPRRLFRRYVLGNAVFLLRSLKLSVQTRKAT